MRQNTLRAEVAQIVVTYMRSRCVPKQLYLLRAYLQQRNQPFKLTSKPTKYSWILHISSLVYPLKNLSFVTWVFSFGFRSAYFWGQQCVTETHRYDTRDSGTTVHALPEGHECNKIKSPLKWLNGILQGKCSTKCVWQACITNKQRNYLNERYLIPTQSFHQGQ